MEFTDQALKMAGALAVVVSLLLGGMFLLKRVMGESSVNLEKSMLRLLGGLRLGQGKAIMLVEVAGEVLVLGTTTRDLTLLTRVTEEPRVEQLRTSAGQTLAGLRLLSPGLWRRKEDVSTMLPEKVDVS